MSYLQAKEPMQITEYFSSIEDPRREQGLLHSLSSIFGLTILAVICGITSWEQISFFGRLRKRELEEILDFSNGIPSHDTIERVFSAIDPTAFHSCFIAWTQALYKSKGLISLDGKESRASFDRINNRQSLYLINAWASENRLVLGQFKVEGKGHEIAGIKNLLEILDIKDSIISIDAIGCQKDIAETIIDKKANYILAVKGNQEKLRNDITSSFTLLKPNSSHDAVEKNNGRMERRKCSVITNLKMIEKKNDWKQLQSIIQIESTRTIHGQQQEQIRYYISSLNVSAETFNQYIRAHWGIENSLHWVLDVNYQDDKSRKRKGHSAQNFALVKKIAINLINQEKKSGLPPSKKRMRATFDFQYLKSILNSDA